MAKITKLTNFGRPLTKIDEPMQMRPRKALNETANSPKKKKETKIRNFVKFTKIVSLWQRASRMTQT